jgi:hypothetical protein
MSNRIVEIEYELFLSIRNGHRPSNDDCYKNKRTELEFLRCLYFGIESKFCKIKKGT